MTRRLFEIALICITFGIALVEFFLSPGANDAGILLMACVSLGTGIDFLHGFLGKITNSTLILTLYARTRFSLLNFGIIFTPLCAAFILQRTGDAPGCARLAENYPWLLAISLLTGGLFLFARYRPDPDSSAQTYILDKSHSYTRTAFILRRVVLVLSLAIAIVVMAEGLQTELMLWCLLFGIVFIATVPLHILRRHLASMTAEVVTLAILFYGILSTYR